MKILDTFQDVEKVEEVIRLIFSSGDSLNSKCRIFLSPHDIPQPNIY